MHISPSDSVTHHLVGTHFDGNAQALTASQTAKVDLAEVTPQADSLATPASELLIQWDSPQADPLTDASKLLIQWDAPQADPLAEASKLLIQWDSPQADPLADASKLLIQWDAPTLLR